MDSKFKLTAITTIVIASLTLGGCGGGGGSSGSNGSSGTATGTTTPTAPTTPTTPIAPTTPTTPTSTIVTSVPAATYSQGSMSATIYSQLNALRQAIGSGLLTQNAKLDAAAAAHMNYLAVNGIADPSFHYETAGQTGFTGVDPSSRASVAEYTGSVGEVGASTLTAGAVVNSVSQWSNSVYHVVVILGGALDVGVAAGDNVFTQIPGAVASTSVVDFGAHSGVAPQMPAAGTVLMYPYAGATGIPTSFNNQAEEPVPATDLHGVGAPVAVNFNTNIYSISSFTITNSGTAVAARILASPSVTGTGVVADGNMQAGYMVLLPTAALLPNTTYSVSFTAVVGASAGTATSVSKTWTFTTGS